jgi:catechol 2,3-dioxygenase-like lactoylglutathione lyase family enzyme
MTTATATSKAPQRTVSSHKQPDSLIESFWGVRYHIKDVCSRGSGLMNVQVYGCNHVAIEVDDVEKAVAFYQDVFNLQKLDEGEGDAFFKLGEHQFLAMFEVEEMKPDRMRHFGIMVRDEAQIAEVREKITTKYGLKLIPGFRCDFRDPFGNRIQVVDLHDESLVWLLPYQEVQKVGIKFSG